MVPVALLREDVLAHAIWTVPVASSLAVADHRRHHSFELEFAEVPVSNSWPMLLLLECLPWPGPESH